MKLRTLVGLIALTSASVAQAGLVSELGTGWTIFGDDNGHVGPGSGAQAFDAEYLFYKLEGTELTIGLQTGFDLNTNDGRYNHTDGKDYFAGDIALSFNGSSSSYEYGIDFGFYTEGWSRNAIDTGTGDGKDAAGLYAVSDWSNDVYYSAASAPYAIDDGTHKQDIIVTKGSGVSHDDTYGDGTSYFRTATFDLAGLGLSDPFELDAHWTMSCGNDAIDGHASVPEPESIALLGLGLLGLGFARRRSVKA